jgi:hypothetical protein
MREESHSLPAHQRAEIRLTSKLTEFIIRAAIAQFAGCAMPTSASDFRRVILRRVQSLLDISSDISFLV